VCVVPALSSRDTPAPLSASREGARAKFLGSLVEVRPIAGAATLAFALGDNLTAPLIKDQFAATILALLATLLLLVARPFFRFFQVFRLYVRLVVHRFHLSRFGHGSPHDWHRR